MKTKFIFCLSVLVALVIHSTVKAQPHWIQKANAGGGKRAYANSFAIGNKGYVFLGFDKDGISNRDVWEYDMTNNTWSQKADFPGNGRIYPYAFSIGSKGYVGGGMDSTDQLFSDFYEFDPVANNWTPKAPMPSGPRVAAASFNLGTKGYVAAGASTVNPPTPLKDLWEYDPVLNSWSQKADLSGGERLDVVWFCIGNKAYVGGGSTGSIDKTDLWEYDPTLNSWTQKANIPGNARYGAVSFPLNGKGYMGLGGDMNDYLIDFHRYDPQANSWSSIGNYGGSSRGYSFGFSSNGRAFVGGGVNDGTQFTVFDDFYELIDGSVGIKQYYAKQTASFFDNQNKAIVIEKGDHAEGLKVSLYDYNMQRLRAGDLTNDKTLIDVADLSPGIYFLEIRSETGVEVRKMCVY
jgi:N-acetylneuraminic acid mutarotase